MQQEFILNGIYHDAFGTEKITISSNGIYLTTEIRGVKFSGNGFDSLSLDENTITDFSQVPLCGSGQDLHNCYFNIELPFIVETQNNIRYIKAQYETWNSRSTNNDNNFSSKYALTLNIDDIVYRNEEHDLYSAMATLTKDLPSHVKLKCCFTCKLSCYEPYERPQMGEILCFKGIKDEFLQIDWGSNIYRSLFYRLNLIGKKTMYVTESYCCSEYMSR